MAKKIALVHETDVVPTYFAGRESARIITQERAYDQHAELTPLAARSLEDKR